MQARRRALLPVLLVLGACDADEVGSQAGDVREIAPQENRERDVVSTDLEVDLATRTATAHIVLAPGEPPGGLLRDSGAGGPERPGSSRPSTQSTRAAPRASTS